MKSESSTVVALRGLVMLGCLLLIPVAALWGGSVPELVKQLIQHHLGLETASASTAMTSAPPFAPGTAADPALSGPGGVPASLPPLSPPVVQLGPQAVPASAAALPPARLPQAAAPAAMPPAPALAQAQVTGIPAAVPAGNSAVVPVGYQAPAEPRPAEAFPREITPPARQTAPSVYQRKPGLVPVTLEEGLPPSPGPEPGKTPSAEPFQQIQNRLRQMGATYYLLESWGVQGDLYRFYCKMAVGGNANYTRYFEAVDSDPLRVMSKVLQDVETWRSGQSM